MNPNLLFCDADCNHGPHVTWLMCAHVENEYLRTAIESCLSQTFKSYELIIVLNGPYRDQIEVCIANWFGANEKIRIYKTEIQHLNFSLNLGLHLSRAKYIARMDSDDVADPCRLERQVNFMDSNSQVSVLGTSYKIVDEAGVEIKSVRNPLSNETIRRSLYFRNPINHPSVIMRKSCILKVGGYISGQYAEDYDLWCRLSLDGSNKFENLKDEILSYRVFGVGSARKSRRAYITMAATQLNMFLLGGNVLWIFSILISVMKSLFLARRP